MFRSTFHQTSIVRFPNVWERLQIRALVQFETLDTHQVPKRVWECLQSGAPSQVKILEARQVSNRVWEWSTLSSQDIGGPSGSQPRRVCRVEHPLISSQICVVSAEWSTLSSQVKYWSPARFPTESGSGAPSQVKILEARQVPNRVWERLQIRAPVQVDALEARQVPNRVSERLQSGAPVEVETSEASQVACLQSVSRVEHPLK